MFSYAYSNISSEMLHFHDSQPSCATKSEPDPRNLKTKAALGNSYSFHRFNYYRGLLLLDGGC